MTSEPIIRVAGLAQRFGHRTLYRDVSFTVNAGEIFVISCPEASSSLVKPNIKLSAISTCPS